MNKYVQLHLHLDGSVDTELAYTIAKRLNFPQADFSFERFKQLMIAPECDDLQQYLNCFHLPLSLLQDEQSISEITYNLMERLAKGNHSYAEIRFAPQLHTKKGMTMEEALLAVLDARTKAMENYPQLETNIICCMMIMNTISYNHDENMDTIELAAKYLNKGVCAVDLAGPEGLTPMEKYRPYFEYATMLKVPFTIHAGEAQGSENVALALEFGTKRVGHGGHILEDMDLVQKAIEQNITFELCPTSNVDCKNQPSYKEHAIIKLYQLGAKVTLNTDNMTLSNITIEDEFNIAKQLMGFSDRDIIIMQKNAIEASFASEGKKKELIDYYNQLLNNS